MKDKNNLLGSVNKIKSTGVGISHKEIIKDGLRAYKENASEIALAEREQSVLRMKSYYRKRGWSFPPKTMASVTNVHLINEYYGKEVCVHTPKDKLEKKLKV